MLVAATSRCPNVEDFNFERFVEHTVLGQSRLGAVVAETPLHVFEWLMASFSRTNGDLQHALVLASKFDRIDIVQSLLTLPGVCEGSHIIDALIQAAKQGHYHVVCCLGAELQRTGTAMPAVIEYGHYQNKSLLDVALRGFCKRESASSAHSYLLVMKYLVEIGSTSVDEVLPAHHLNDLIAAHFDWQRRERAYDKNEAATYHEVFDLLVSVGNCPIKDITGSVYLGVEYNWVDVTWGYESAISDSRMALETYLRILLAVEHYLKFLTTNGVDIQDLKFPYAAPVEVLAIQIAQQELWKTINALGKGISLGQLKELVCEQSLDFDGQDKAGRTLLHVVRMHATSCAFRLYSRITSSSPADTIERLFVFSQAAAHDRSDVIAWLVLERGVDLHQRTRDGATVAKIAKQSGSTNSMACLQQIDATRVIGSFIFSQMRWREARRLASERYNAVVRIQSMCRSRAHRHRE